MTVRVGVVGAGGMGVDHVRLPHGYVSGAEAVAVTDVAGAHAKALRTPFRERGPEPTPWH